MNTINAEPLRPVSGPHDLPAEEVNAIFRGFRALMADCRRLKVNKDDQAIILIKACILEGFNTGRRITGTLEKLGFNRRHAGKTLAEGTGDDPHDHHWWRAQDGQYHLHSALPVNDPRQ